jgi:acetylornithine deacetylase/succinyl-diaminopimelate desuccinylase-like protein
VAGRTVFNIDYRAADEGAFQAMSECIAGLLQTVTEKHNLNYEAEIMHHTPAMVSKSYIRFAFEQGAETAGIAHQPLVSWAAHDAMNMAHVTDSGMMFVPCRDGRSHTPEEYVEPDDIATGIAVLANAILSLAR